MENLEITLGQTVTGKALEKGADRAEKQKNIYRVLLILYILAYSQYIFQIIGLSLASADDNTSDDSSGGTTTDDTTEDVGASSFDFTAALPIIIIFVKMYFYLYYSLALEVFIFENHKRLSKCTWLFCGGCCAFKAMLCCYCCRLTCCMSQKKYNSMQQFDPGYQKYGRWKKIFFVAGLIDTVIDVISGINGSFVFFGSAVLAFLASCVSCCCQ